MANGTKYTTKNNLLTEGIQAVVYENDDNETTSDNIQKLGKNIVETLWDRTAPPGIVNQTLKYDSNGFLIVNQNLTQDDNGVALFSNINASSPLSGRKLLVLYGNTTDATVTSLKLSSILDSISIPAGTAVKIKAEIVGVQTAGSAGTIGDMTARTMQGAVRNTAISGVLSLINFTTIEVCEDSSLSGCNIGTNSTIGNLFLTVQGQVNKTIKWIATVTLTFNKI